MDRPTGVFINYLTVCCQSLSIKKMIELTQEELKQYFSEPIFGHIAETADDRKGVSTWKTLGAWCVRLCFQEFRYGTSEI